MNRQPPRSAVQLQTMRQPTVFLAVTVALLVAVAGTALNPEDGADSQLSTVQVRIKQLEAKLVDLEHQSANARQQHSALSAEVELAEARVQELELVLASTQREAERLGREAEKLALELERRRQVLARHFEMMALLGRPGPAQLFYDAVRGGDLERAVDTVAVLTTAQVHLLQEYQELQLERNRRLASFSRALAEAERETRELARRRAALKKARSSLERSLRRLERSSESTSNRLTELRSRAQALERLLTVVAARKRLTGKENVSRYRGALPWPAEGEVMETFGRHYQARYATYTVCNGIRLNPKSTDPVTAVFPGIVAYAQHFKGYGNMVVVDHGNDVYSVVAGLATIHVRVNQGVTMGQRLGLALPPAPQGSLYVEMRVAGKAQDPRRWLQLRQGED